METGVPTANESECRHDSNGCAIRLTTDLGLDSSSFQGTYAVNKEDSLQMIMFVLNGSRKEATGLKL